MSIACFMWADILHAHQFTTCDESVSACFVKHFAVRTEHLSILQRQPRMPIFPFLIELGYSYIITFCCWCCQILFYMNFFHFRFVGTFALAESDPYLYPIIVFRSKKQSKSYGICYLVMRTTKIASSRFYWVESGNYRIYRASPLRELWWTEWVNTHAGGKWMEILFKLINYELLRFFSPVASDRHQYFLPMTS